MLLQVSEDPGLVPTQVMPEGKKMRKKCIVWNMWWKGDFVNFLIN